MRYLFKHILLRDAAYNIQLPAQLRAMHRNAAKAIEELYAHDLPSHYADLAYHYDKAQDTQHATHYARLAGESALAISDFGKALAFFEWALQLVPSLDLEQAMLLVNLGVVHERLGEYALARERLEAGLARAQAANDLETQANALSALSWVAVKQDDRNQGWSLAAKALVLAQRVGNRNVEALALRRLGVIAHYQRNDATATRYYEKSLALYREAGDRSGTASCLNNLGEIYRKKGDYQTAARYYEESLEIFRQIGSRRGAAICLNNLGYIAISLDDDRAARRYFRAALTEAMTISVSPIVLDTLIGEAELRAKAGERAQAAELLGLALNHPMCDNEVKLSARPVLTALRAMLPSDEFEAALERGKSHKLEKAIKTTLVSQE